MSGVQIGHRWQLDASLGATGSGRPDVLGCIGRISSEQHDELAEMNNEEIAGTSGLAWSAPRRQPSPRASGPR